VRRPFTFLAVGLAVVLAAPATPAGASVPQPYERTDTVNEVPYKAGDIKKIRIAYTDTLRLTVFARENRDADSPAWRNPNGKTNIIWRLLDDPGTHVDWTIKLVSRAAGATVRVTDEAGTLVETCDIHVSFANVARYQITISPDCLGDPVTVRAQATFNFKPTNQAASQDRAPGGGYTAAVERAV
jgi:hypothetical protein